MYREPIKKILKITDMLPEELLSEYLKRMYPNLTKNQTHQAIYSAVRAGCCFKDANGYIVKARNIPFNSQMAKRFKAFKVFLEFCPNAVDLTQSSYPWIYSFFSQNKFIQVGYIEHSREFTSSIVFAECPIPLDERPTISRICIVDENCNIERIKATGFRFFCTVDDNYKLKIIKKINFEDAWKDVPAK